jgi:uncharacterized membrane protein YfcA
LKWPYPVELLNLTTQNILFLSLITFTAGMVRGFSGFALSALVMATGVLILPPVQLIPICWWLEMMASLLMVRGGWREADRTVVVGLVLGSALGVPFGLLLTTSLPVETSTLIALLLVVGLALTQLANIRLAFLATRPGLWGSGILAGIVTGLASIGGMVVALYVLARDAPARQMRASLVLFLFLSALTSMITYSAYGVMDQTAILRGLAFAIPTALGVIVGKMLFMPSLERFYRPFCLSLLIGLAGLSLVRLGVSI